MPLARGPALTTGRHRTPRQLAFCSPGLADGAAADAAASASSRSRQ